MTSTAIEKKPSRVLPFRDPSRRRRLTKVTGWLVGIAAALVILNVLGVDVVRWVEDLWDEIKAVPVGYILAGLTFQTGVTVLAGVSYYGILSAAYPGEVTRSDRDRLCGRRGHERFPAREHRHLRHAFPLRGDHPVLQVPRARSPPTSCRRSSSSQGPSSTSTSSCRCRARSTRTWATSRITPCLRSPSLREAHFSSSCSAASSGAR